MSAAASGHFFGFSADFSGHNGHFGNFRICAPVYGHFSAAGWPDFRGGVETLARFFPGDSVWPYWPEWAGWPRFRLFWQRIFLRMKFRYPHACSGAGGASSCPGRGVFSFISVVLMLFRHTEDCLSRTSLAARAAPFCVHAAYPFCGTCTAACTHLSGSGMPRFCAAASLRAGLLHA